MTQYHFRFTWYDDAASAVDGVDGELNFYVTLTTECNLHCLYCYGKSCDDFGGTFNDLSVDYAVPSSITYETETLLSFLSSDPKATVIFYGGEPLMNPGKLKEFMDAMPHRSFVIQTNGILLDQLESKYVNRFKSIFVSLDGNEALTDHYRGEGTSRKVIGNLLKIREEGFSGEIVARMTVGEATEIDEQVLELIANPLISAVHWQLDALFWENDYRKREFSKWVHDSYNPGVKRLVRSWVEHMRSEGKVWRLYPFMGIVESLLRADVSRLRCGAGWCVFNIQTDGHITPCPVMAGMKDYYLGSIESESPETLRAVSVGDPCRSCDILSVCGGRCLYANTTKLWGHKGYFEVCETVLNLVTELSGVLPDIEMMLQEGTVAPEDFAGVTFDGCEVIP